MCYTLLQLYLLWPPQLRMRKCNPFCLLWQTEHGCSMYSKTHKVQRKFAHYAKNLSSMDLIYYVYTDSMFLLKDKSLRRNNHLTNENFSQIWICFLKMLFFMELFRCVMRMIIIHCVKKKKKKALCPNTQEQQCFPNNSKEIPC